MKKMDIPNNFSTLKISTPFFWEKYNYMVENGWKKVGIYPNKQY